MTTLLSAERYKLLHSRVFAIILAGVAVMKAFFVLAPHLMNVTPTAPGGNTAASAGYASMFTGISGVKLMNGESIILVLWFMAFVGFFVASEFQDGTIRHALSLGKRRTWVFATKLLAALMALTAIFAVTILTAVVGRSVLYGFGDMRGVMFMGYFAGYFFWQLLCHVPYAAMFCLFAFIGRNPGMSIMLSVGYLMFNSFAQSFIGNFPELNGALLLFPDYYIYNLEAGIGDVSFIIRLAVVSAAYMVMAFAVGCAAFNKSDVK